MLMFSFRKLELIVGTHISLILLFLKALRKEEAKGGLAHQPVVELFHWNTCCTPLRSGSVDTIISDLPFGVRSGSAKVNRISLFLVSVSLGRTQDTTSSSLLFTHKYLLKMPHVQQNRFIYPKALKELARITKSGGYKSTTATCNTCKSKREL